MTRPSTAEQIPPNLLHYGMEPAIMTLDDEDLSAMKLRMDQIWSDKRKREQLCDTIIYAENGGEFFVHRSIMAQSSPYFQALFTTKVGRQGRFKYTIPGISESMLGCIVDFAYTGITQVCEENVAELLPAVDQFNVLSMLSECVEFLMNKIDPSNCIGVRNFARMYFCSNLADFSDRYLRANFTEVVSNSEEFLEMSPQEMLSLLISDRINTRNEETVWEAGLRWVEHCPKDRKCYIRDILKSVRLGLLDTSYFMNHVKQHPYVDKNESCKPIVMENLQFLWDINSIHTKTEPMETPFLVTPRIPHEVLFVVGGWSGGLPTALVETYDTKADRWIRVPETDTRPRAYHKLAVIGCEIYVIGGYDGNEYFNSCRCFNVIKRQWREIAPMHNKRCYVSVAVLDDVIYAIGGYDGHYRQNSVEKYDRNRNQWTLITPMSSQRSDACATALNGRIYVIGGFNGSECLSSSEFYDPTIGQWSVIPSMRQRRSGVSAIAYHGHVYALGGFNGTARLLNGEKYDPSTQEWTWVRDMFHPRSNFAIEIVDDMIFAIGGFNGVTTILNVECYDDRTDEWLEATSMGIVRSALAACVISGLPDDIMTGYVHQNRTGLMEEKRQKVRQQRAIMDAREQHNRVDGLNDDEELF